MQNFYEQAMDGTASRCANFDTASIAWRKVAARYNRGIQEPPAHGAPHSEG